MLTEANTIYVVTRIAWLVMAWLSVYRLAHIIVAEDGPLDLAVKLRELIYLRTSDGSLLQRGFACVLCISFWLSWLVVLLLPWAGWRAYVLESLSVAGACLILHRRLYGDS